MSTETKPRQPAPAMNKVAKFILSSPLHFLFSKHLMLLTFKGRKSGKLFTTPIGYQQQGESVICFTDHHWWKNLVADPEVTLRLRGRVLTGRAETVHGNEETARELAIYIGRSPMLARAFNIEVDAQKQPVPESFQRVAAASTLIRIHLNA
ncbi:nitroreductase/quinone reductase family protein [Tengunoibacter tsumagoiensis]|uniref:Nitroreductase n=1 Tax=Tengunoibacter tsumagoiensis TaxID=2014871 RepID=A0A401ZZD9_9CHLR|nr:nitroreductase/quinone reductase family protein [Tengunoibacter tsumagoiensis]GCE12224.1 hypothetical protein KTT_20830 [Tengunoibacter tsumagoiensis]